MKLTITEQALEQIKVVNVANKRLLALTYDIDGCGCGVNGMPTVTLIENREKSHQDVECGEMDVVVDIQQATFFSNEMTLDYNGATFRLTSPNEMLNPFIHVNTIA
ncbi:iron-sulfur cluster biosynthesis family protein [Gracilibacillus sp. S3-1-1]|uniref:Iron-sulfur cluster biosynthesis family protein n=1 Tax=Gracilibacillus pellucidus TaxID=3095368 RepID=A0ACC6M515_9BACI|nr:iron-sulfur cluster biosynthesis family protein [Gracilibacillus sp. S3-1-1]MDX8046060.1 iron-sulfur cluster biosynthesis family protein [Gracilibacillus sp. S3-1-1]